MSPGMPAKTVQPVTGHEGINVNYDYPRASIVIHEVLHCRGFPSGPSGMCRVFNWEGFRLVDHPVFGQHRNMSRLDETGHNASQLALQGFNTVNIHL